MTKRLLLINFDFPPNQGIGGRRWAKMAKGFAQRGFELDVIKSDPIAGNKTSSWYGDVQSSRIRIYSLSRPLCSSFISHPRRGILGKVLYRFGLVFNRICYSGTPFDVSLGWEKVLTNKLVELTKAKTYDAVIATGAPWNMLYVVAQFMTRQNSIKFIVDYRDPWIEAKNYGMPGLSARRMQCEVAKELFVLGAANIVMSPYPYLTQRLQKRIGSDSHRQTRFVTLEHFYDPDDIPKRVSTAHPKKAFRIVYGGDIYIGAQELLKKIAQDLKAINDELSEKDIRVIIDLYTDSSVDPEIISSPFIQLHASIGRELFVELQNSNACLILLPEHKKEEKTTKFYEYLATGKPMIVAAKDGAVLDFIRDMNLGYSWSVEGKHKWIEAYISGAMCNSEKYDISKESVNARVDYISRLLV